MNEERFKVIEVEVEKDMENFHFPFRVLDTHNNTKGLSSYRTRDAAQAIADTRNQFAQIVGLSVEEAQVILKGKQISVIEKNGVEAGLRSLEYRPNRVNVVVINDKVAYVHSVG
jgi:hypothetical protein